jgi:hypothetical protein
MGVRMQDLAPPSETDKENFCWGETMENRADEGHSLVSLREFAPGKNPASATYG